MISHSWSVSWLQVFLLNVFASWGTRCISGRPCDSTHAAQPPSFLPQPPSQTVRETVCDHLWSTHKRQSNIWAYRYSVQSVWMCAGATLLHRSNSTRNVHILDPDRWGLVCGCIEVVGGNTRFSWSRSCEFLWSYTSCPLGVHGSHSLWSKVFKRAKATKVLFII